jgi:hypothetical protein
MTSINLSKSVPEFNNILNDDFNSKHLYIKKIFNKENQFKLIKYRKNAISCDNESSFGLCRSIILNDVNQIICFSPPKSINKNVFVNKYPKLDSNFLVEELVEGTMINMFYNKGHWDISTKSVIGADTSFFKSDVSVSFRKMFFDTYLKSGLTYQMFDKRYCYSFVLQHPHNRIVVPFTEPNLKLIAIYHIETNVDGDFVVKIVDKYKYWSYHLNSSFVQLNNTYETQSYDILDEKYASKNTSYDILGYVVYNTTTGERMKMRNPNYEEVKKLRGNQTKLQFQYLYLRSQGKVKDYLKYYPESKQAFSKYRDDVHRFTSNLYTNYRNCYVKKEKPLKKYEKQFRTHMYHIHKLFLTNLKEKNKFVDINMVIKYVNNMKPDHLMYSLNFHHRNKTIDETYYEVSV